MIANTNRNGNFTSSEIHRLMTNGKKAGELGKPAISYIEEKNFERKLGRSLGTETNSRPTSWGKFIEQRAFDLLGLKYKICSTTSIKHPTIDYWSGSPDCETFENEKTVVDIKCPITLKSFCQLVSINTAERLKGEYPEYYWQLVSNSILVGAKYAELVVYCPYQSELEEIRQLASNFDGNQNKIAWIGFAEDNDLPYLIEGGYYKNLNIFRFEVSNEDKIALTKRVEEAGKLLEAI